MFFFNDQATTEIYTYIHTLALHDALPFSHRRALPTGGRCGGRRAIPAARRSPMPVRNRRRGCAREPRRTAPPTRPEVPDRRGCGCGKGLASSREIGRAHV